MSRRALITMSSEEVRAFIASERVVTCATVGPGGRPHLMPLWYVPDDDAILAWTYRRSQKARNLQRLPQATLQFETGETYDQLRGVMSECDVELIEEVQRVAEIGLAVLARYAGGESEGMREGVAAQAPKRIGLRFTPTRTVSWDHRKLGGGY